MTGASAWRALRRAVREFVDDRASLKAAGIAFYALVAVVPLFALAIAVAGIVVGQDAARQVVEARIADLLGSPAARVAAAVFDQLGPRHTAGLGVASLAIALYGAFRLLVHTQGAVNDIWRAHSPPPVASVNRWRHLVARQLPALGVLIGLMALLLASTLVDVALNISWSHDLSVMPRGGVWIAETLASLLTLTALHAVVYKVLPNAPVRWRDAWPAAFVISLAFVVMKAGICFYIGHRALLSVSAALGSVLALMVWIDAYATLFLLGVELTQVLSNRSY